MPLFYLDKNKLEPGDIILTNNKNSKSRFSKIQSGIIRFFSGGNYSHAMIHVGHGVCVEAINPNVKLISLSRFAIINKENVSILRHENKKISMDAADIANNENGKFYDLAACLTSTIAKNSKKPEKIKNKIFCSELIALSYKKAGCGEFSKYLSKKITPNSFKKIKALKNISDTVIKKAEFFQENISYLDGDRVSDDSKYSRAIGLVFEKSFPHIDLYIKKHGCKNKPSNFLEILDFLDNEIIKNPKAISNLDIAIYSEYLKQDFHTIQDFLAKKQDFIMIDFLINNNDLNHLTKTYSDIHSNFRNRLNNYLLLKIKFMKSCKLSTIDAYISDEYRFLKIYRKMISNFKTYIS